MSTAPFQFPAQFNSDEARKVAEKGLAQTREAFEKVNAAAKEALVSVDASTSVVVKGLSEFNAKAFEAFQANTASTFELLTALSGAKSASELAALAPSLVNKQVEALKDQTKDLTALAQKIVTEAAAPLKDVASKTFKA
jgi:phasin